MGLFGKHGEFLAQVHPVTQFVYRLLAVADNTGCGGGLEPVGEGILADAGAGRAEELEEAALAEEVQVERVGVFRVGLTLPGFASPGPFAVKPGKTGFIEMGGPAEPLDPFDDAVMKQNQHHKDGDRYQH